MKRGDPARARWFIQLNVRPAQACGYRWGRKAYVRHVWPLLFRSYEDAFDYADKMGRALWTAPPGKRPIKSFSIEKTFLLAAASTAKER